MLDIQKQVRDGIAPILDKIEDKMYSSNDNPAIVAMMNAIENCYQPNPKKRHSAREIAGILLKTMTEIEKTQER